jgi:HEAT repeat protein
LLEAVKDPAPLRSTIAVRVLCRLGTQAARDAVGPLLEDPRPTVRMEAAIGLLQAHDARAFPVLVDLVAVLPPAQRSQVESLLGEVAGEWGIATPPGHDATSARVRGRLWAAWWQATDGEHLLAQLRGRTLTNEERKEALGLIADLHHPAADRRQKASAELVGRFGERALSLLRRAVQEPGASKTEAVVRCLEAIERGAPQPLPDATFRLLALRRPRGTALALLAYAPFTESPSAQNELEEALAVLACPDGKPVSALLAALEDPVPTRRSLVATVLCRAADKEHLAAARKLLQDDDPLVRKQAALGLAQRGQKDAVAVLIRLLGELPEESASQVESVLTQLAGDSAPQTASPGAQRERGPIVEAWRKWWQENSKRVELARLTRADLGEGLVAIEQHGQPVNAQGRVLGIDSRGKVRWEVGSLTWPTCARAMPNGRVLIVEQASRLTLRDRKGKVLWERSHPNVYQVEPLPGGNLLVLCRNEITELSRDGKVVFSHPEQIFIMGGNRLPNGHIGYFTQMSTYVRLDARGKVLKTANVPLPLHLGLQGLEVLPRDRFLVSLANASKVCEFDLHATAIWETEVPMAGFPHRLPNGRTLVVRNNSNEIVELDRRGKIVAERKDLPYRPFRLEGP